MKFSVDQESVADIISALNSYSDDIDSEFRKFEGEIKKIVIKTNYNKLLNALQGIIDVYNDVICGSMRKQLISQWLEEGESLHKFAEDVYMGEESEEAVKRIENSLEEIFIGYSDNELIGMEFSGEPNVTRGDFDDVEDCFDSFTQEIDRVRESNSEYFDSKSEDNELYLYLIPVVESIAVGIAAFFSAAKKELDKLGDNYVERMEGAKQRVEEAKKKKTSEDFDLDLFDFDDDESIALKENTRGNFSKSLNDKLDGRFDDKFKEVTSLLYRSIVDDELAKKKKISYDTILAIMPIYHKFYSEFGDIWKDKFSSLEEKEDFIKREYIGVTMERGNGEYFNDGDEGTFISYATHTYRVFDRVADMVKNIAHGCMAGKATDVNLVYGAYVLFTPIVEGYIDKENCQKYKKFSKSASEEILRILGIEKEEEKEGKVGRAEQQKAEADKNEEFVFEGESFSDENIKLFVSLAEQIVNQVGVDELNSLVEKNYEALNDSRKTYSHNVSKRNVSEYNMEHEIDSNIYGRYTVTRKSIQAMIPACSQVNLTMEPIDKFYKENFEKLGKGFKKASDTIHQISALCTTLGLGSADFSKLYSKSESDSDSESDSSWKEKVKLGGSFWANSTKIGKILTGGAFMLKIMDWAMPNLQKSKLLVKSSEKVWDLTRQDIQTSYFWKMADLYMMEHYEIKYEKDNKIIHMKSKEQGSYFELYHEAIKKIEDDHQRRAFENSIFAAEMFMQNYSISETDPQKVGAIRSGVFLNLVRSGMCSEQNIEARTANGIVDKLYDVYKEKWKVIPRVDINPENRVLQ